MKKIFSAAMFAASLGILSCNGNYDADPNTSNSNISNPLNTNNGGGGNNGGGNALTTGSWIVTAYTYTTGGQTTDLLTAIDECEKDNIFTFNQDNTITIDEGGRKCNDNDPQTTKDQKWNLNGNQFTITSSMGDTPWDVVTLDNTTFKISRTFTINGISGTAAQTYGRP